MTTSIDPVRKERSTGFQPVYFRQTRVENPCSVVSYKGVMVPYKGAYLGLGTGTATINKEKIAMPVTLWKEEDCGCN